MDGCVLVMSKEEEEELLSKGCGYWNVPDYHLHYNFLHGQGENKGRPEEADEDLDDEEEDFVFSRGGSELRNEVMDGEVEEDYAYPLETIQEETSDDLRSDNTTTDDDESSDSSDDVSDSSGGWLATGSESGSVIRIQATIVVEGDSDENCDSDREMACPAKRRCLPVQLDGSCLLPCDDSDLSSLSRSSSLVQFENLEKQMQEDNNNQHACYYGYDSLERAGGRSRALSPDSLDEDVLRTSNLAMDDEDEDSSDYYKQLKIDVPLTAAGRGMRTWRSCETISQGNVAAAPSVVNLCESNDAGFGRASSIPDVLMIVVRQEESVERDRSLYKTKVQIGEGVTGSSGDWAFKAYDGNVHPYHHNYGYHNNGNHGYHQQHQQPQQGVFLGNFGVSYHDLTSVEGAPLVERFLRTKKKNKQKRNEKEEVLSESISLTLVTNEESLKLTVKEQKEEDEPEVSIKKKKKNSEETVGEFKRGGMSKKIQNKRVLVARNGDNFDGEVSIYESHYQHNFKREGSYAEAMANAIDSDGEAYANKANRQQTRHHPLRSLSEQSVKSDASEDANVATLTPSILRSRDVASTPDLSCRKSSLINSSSSNKTLTSAKSYHSGSMKGVTFSPIVDEVNWRTSSSSSSITSSSSSSSLDDRERHSNSEFLRLKKRRKMTNDKRDGLSSRAAAMFRERALMTRSHPELDIDRMKRKTGDEHENEDKSNDETHRQRKCNNDSGTNDARHEHTSREGKRTRPPPPPPPIPQHHRSSAQHSPPTTVPATSARAAAIAPTRSASDTQRETRDGTAHETKTPPRTADENDAAKRNQNKTPELPTRGQDNAASHAKANLKINQDDKNVLKVKNGESGDKTAAKTRDSSTSYGDSDGDNSKEPKKTRDDDDDAKSVRTKSADCLLFDVKSESRRSLAASTSSINSAVCGSCKCVSYLNEEGAIITFNPDDESKLPDETYSSSSVLKAQTPNVNKRAEISASANCLFPTGDDSSPRSLPVSSSAICSSCKCISYYNEEGGITTYPSKSSLNSKTDKSTENLAPPKTAAAPDTRITSSAQNINEGYHSSSAICASCNSVSYLNEDGAITTYPSVDSLSSARAASSKSNENLDTLKFRTATSTENVSPLAKPTVLRNCVSTRSLKDISRSCSSSAICASCKSVSYLNDDGEVLTYPSTDSLNFGAAPALKPNKLSPVSSSSPALSDNNMTVVVDKMSANSGAGVAASNANRDNTGANNDNNNTGNTVNNGSSPVSGKNKKLGGFFSRLAGFRFSSTRRKGGSKADKAAAAEKTGKKEGNKENVSNLCNNGQRIASKEDYIYIPLKVKQEDDVDEEQQTEGNQQQRLYQNHPRHTATSPYTSSSHNNEYDYAGNGDNKVKGKPPPPPPRVVGARRRPNNATDGGGSAAPFIDRAPNATATSKSGYSKRVVNVLHGAHEHRDAEEDTRGRGRRCGSPMAAEGHAEYECDNKVNRYYQQQRDCAGDGVEEGDYHRRGPPPPGHKGSNDRRNLLSSQPMGLIETDLDTEVTVITSCNASVKTRSLLDLENGAICGGNEERLGDGRRRPHKSMEFLLDRQNIRVVEPPENELSKRCSSKMSEHELRVQRSLQRLDLPDWYTHNVTRTPSSEGFILHKRTSSTLPSNKWSSTLSPSSGGGASTFVRWSTSRLNAGSASCASTASSPCASTRSSFNVGQRHSNGHLSMTLSPTTSVRSASGGGSFNYRQPYMGWRSQERLSRTPRTPAERLANSILQQQQQQQQQQENNPEIQTSIKEVTSAIVHYVSGLKPDDDDVDAHKRREGGSNQRLCCWLESSFVGTRPLDSPQTPVSLTAPPADEQQQRQASLRLELNKTYHDNGGDVIVLEPPHKREHSSAVSGGRSRRKANGRSAGGEATLEDVLDSLLGLQPSSSGGGGGSTANLASSAANSNSIRCVATMD